MSEKFLEDYADHVEKMKLYGAPSYRSKHRNVEFKSSGPSRMFSGELFKGCEVIFDDEFGQIIFEGRGYQIIFELGNTPDWKTGCSDGGHDDALRVIVMEDDEFDEDNALMNFNIPKRESEND